MALSSTLLQLLYGQVGGEGQYQTLAGLLYGVDSDTPTTGGVDTDAVNMLIEEALANTQGFRQAAIAIANATANMIADTPIAIHLERGIRNPYSTNGNFLLTPINQDLHLGYQIEANYRGGENIATRFIPSRLYARGNLNPAPLTENGSTFNLTYDYSHNSTSGHDQIGLAVDLLSGRGGTPDPLIDIEIYEINVAVVSETGGQTAAQVTAAINAAVATINTRIGEVESDVELNEQTIGINQDNIRLNNEGLRTRASNDALTALGGRVTSLVTAKADKVPFGFDLDHYYYVRSNTEAINYYLAMHDIDASLLPGVDTFHIQMRGITVYRGAFNPSASSEQVVELTVSEQSIGNIRQNLQTADTDILINLFFDNGSTNVHEQNFRIPVLDAPPLREVNVLVEFDATRKIKTQVLPTNYTEYRELIMGTFSGRNNQEALQHIPKEILANQATIADFGQTDNHKFSWDRATRTITYVPTQGAANSGIIFVELI